MTAITAANAFRNAANQGVGKQAFEDLRDFVAQMMGGAAESTLTIAAGVVTPTSGLHSIDTEAAAATDDLDTLAQTNLQDGQFVTISLANAARLVRVRHNIGGAGKVLLKGGSHFTLANTDSFLMLKRAGTTWIEIARFTGPLRERLMANRDYFVRTDGNDGNDGLSNTAGGAFLTLQAAWDAVAALDVAGFTVKIRIANGTYNGALSINKAPLNAAFGTIVIEGQNSTGAILAVTSANAISVTAPATGLVIKDLKITVTTSGNAIFVNHPGAAINNINNVEFGACANTHIRCDDGKILISSNYSISGAAQQHFIVQLGGALEVASLTVTVTGTPAFSGSFALASRGVSTWFSVTFSGAATGTRYSATLNGVINTFGSGANFFPGNAAGSTATGGQYA